MTSANKQVLDRYVQALEERDIDAAMATYRGDAVLVSRGRIGRGPDYIRTVFEAQPWTRPWPSNRKG